MEHRPSVTVVRLGHRPGRDDRMTTHVGLTARALGADRFVLIATDTSPLKQIDDVTDRFGGPFETATADSIGSFLTSFSGTVIHLTMYGLPIQDVIDEIHQTIQPAGDVAVIVGAEKVTFDVYERADWNVAVTNQPHSEVASLALTLDRLSDGENLDRPFIDGTHRVHPKATGKQILPVEEENPQGLTNEPSNGE